MKEELIRVLNAKLDDTNANIDSLVELNDKINYENEKLAYVEKILGLFKTEEGYNILNFVKLSHEDFDKVVQVVLKDNTIFNTESCNYDGLIYLINGINNGVSLSLTEEQKTNIEYLIKGLKSRGEEYTSTIEGLNLVKERFPVSNLDVLSSDKNRFEKVLENLKNNLYIDDTDVLREAITFNKLENNTTIELLSYILKYNADVYAANKEVVSEPKVEDSNEEKEEVTFELPKEEKVSETTDEPSGEEVREEESYDVQEEQPSENNNDYFEFKPVEETSKEPEEEAKEEDIFFAKPVTDHIEEQEEVTFELPREEEVSETTDEPSSEEENDETNVSVAMPFVNVDFELPKEETNEEVEQTPEYDEIKVEEPKEEDIPKVEEVETPMVEEYVPPVESVPEVSEIPEIPEVKDESDFSDIVSSDDYEEEHEEKEEEMSSKELQKLLGEYSISEELVDTNSLIAGNLANYRRVLDALKDNGILDEFVKNRVLFNEVMLNTTDKEIFDILKIIKEDLSVDDEDYEITLRIVINTIPSVFIREGGNYDNFMANINLFKKLDVNLINLFDFSKEVLIADNEKMLNNLDVVNTYNVKIEYNNAKYLLLLPNIAERIDYYIESVYPDKTKNNEIFDGINFVNNYAVKLNVVSPLTIKRLRYASENGSKVFGSKPYSLSGEITNLKVNALEINDNYLNNFFDNNFDGITSEEVKQFVKLIHNTSNVGNYGDELDVLEKYHQGLRYVIGNINVSYNKVVRNYNILRSYGVSNSKALHFAVCYNLMITKDEYANLKSVLELGGNA